MQKFYNQLVTSEDTHVSPLKRLTQCSLEEVNSIKNELFWEIWD